MDLFNLLIKLPIPVKDVTMSSQDPPYVTPLVKSMLRKRYRLHRSGHTAEAIQLATKINLVIQDTRSRQYHKLAEASPKRTMGCS